ncbi:hypothetical protein ACO0K0_11370 [Undibacterium sp. SXout11W]|uniref:hypothetical protein n=1 Tax=Undibacterium sp. SXout11W TaxID=3413050 RepID=UPI003BF3B36A
MRRISLRLLIIYLMLVMLPLQSLASSGWSACLSTSSVNDEKAVSVSHCGAMLGSFAVQADMTNKVTLKKMDFHGYCKVGAACCGVVTLPTFHFFTPSANNSDPFQIAAPQQFSSIHSAALERPPKFLTV